MPHIHLTTFIAAPVERVFDLSRHIGLHKRSMIRFGEQAVSGKLSGFMGLNDIVTWRAKHLLKERALTVKITSMQKPFFFIDEQVRGDFKKMKHEHYFKPCDNGTIMIDQFNFLAPYGRVGDWFNKFYLTNYMTQLLEERNSVIKSVAETSQWKHYLIYSHA
jgi:ligand-binding SRPBCC domain-containing protein